MYTPRAIAPDDEYPLWGFTNGTRFVWTRGRTREEAWHYAKRDFPAGVTIWVLADISFQVRDTYTRSHPFDWLHQPMRWLTDLLTVPTQPATAEDVIARVALALKFRQ